MIRTKKLLAIAAAGALVFAACGSDDDSGDDASTPAATDAPDTTDASESTDATESTDASESTDATESTDAPDTTDAPDSTEAGEASGAVFVVDAFVPVSFEFEADPVKNVINLKLKNLGALGTITHTYSSEKVNAD